MTQYLNLEALLWTVGVAVLAALAAGFITARRNRQKFLPVVTGVLLVGALAAILWISFAARRHAAAASYNLIPFRGIKDQLENLNSALGLLNIFGNVAMYIPIGLLIPLARERGWIHGLLVGVVLSLTVEVLQLLTERGAMDIDDFILNITGASLGAGIAAVAQHNAYLHQLLRPQSSKNLTPPVEP